MKPNGLELGDKMLVPNPACLLLPINILVDFQDLVSISGDYKTLWNFHVHVTFDWSLGKGHDKVNLFGVPALDNGCGKDKADGSPCSI